MRRTSVLVIALLLAVGGCASGGSERDGSASPTPAPSAIRSDLASLFAGDHPGTRENAEGACFADKLTAAVSPDRLRAAGVLDASYDVVADLPPLPKDVADDWADAQLACADFVEASTRAQVKVTHGDLDGGAYASCLRARVTKEEIRAAVAASLTGHFDAAEVSTLSHAQTTCAEQATP